MAIGSIDPRFLVLKLCGPEANAFAPAHAKELERDSFCVGTDDIEPERRALPAAPGRPDERPEIEKREIGAV